MSLCLQTQVQRTQYECGTGIYAEPVSVPPPKKIKPLFAVLFFSGTGRERQSLWLSIKKCLTIRVFMLYLYYVKTKRSHNDN